MSGMVFTVLGVPECPDFSVMPLVIYKNSYAHGSIREGFLESMTLEPLKRNILGGRSNSSRHNIGKCSHAEQFVYRERKRGSSLKCRAGNFHVYVVID